MSDTTTITAGKRYAILHVNRQNIAMNAKDGGKRPVYTLKPDGPNSKAIYARDVFWDGPTLAVADEDQLSCGARAWIRIAPGTLMILTDAMSFQESRKAK